jgi:mRNA interferase MazF
MPAPRANRGEVWQVDLGLAAKPRPVVILALPGHDDRQIFTYVPHTTQPRGTDFEISIPTRFLEEGVFDAQGISTISTHKLMRKLGMLTDEQLTRIEDAVLRWLEIEY